MRSTILATLLFSLLLSAPLSADCPCVPITHVWVVKTCNDWNCASTEQTLAAGDPQVIAMPVALNDSRWLIVRRLAIGGAIDAGDDPFQVQQFERMDDAMTHYGAVTLDGRPMILTAPDGQILVISLKQPEARRRAAVH